MKSKKNKTHVELAGAASAAPINSAFARLADKLPQVAPSAPASDVVTPHAPAIASTPDAQLDAALRCLRRVHAFKSKKGRGGKTVTEVDHLESVETSLLALLCKRLCRRLGCGGSVEGQVIVLQGDQTASVDAYFAAARR